MSDRVDLYKFHCVFCNGGFNDYEQLKKHEQDHIEDRKLWRYSE